MPKLVINPGTTQAREFELRPGTNRLGRTLDNDCAINDASVSSAHAEITLEDGRARLTDLGSANGTFIDREPVSDAMLRPGQVLRLGGVEILYADDSTAAPGIEPAVPPAPARIRITRIGEPPTAPPIPCALPGLRIERRSTAPEPPTAAAAESVAEEVTEVAEPPIAPPMPEREQRKATRDSVCRYHPKTSARWLCPTCQQFFCDLCVGARKAGDATGFFCRTCGVQCAPVDVMACEAPEEERSFYPLVPDAFLYPFRGQGPFIMTCGTAIFVFMEFITRYSRFFSLALLVMFWGYIYAYMQKIIIIAAEGDRQKVDLPDADNLRELCGRFVGVIVLCFGPYFGMLLWSYFEGSPDALVWGARAVLVAGCLYFPMAFLAVAMFDDLVGLHPGLVIPSILRFPFEYLTASALFFIAFYVNLESQKYLNGLTHLGGHGRMAYYDPPLLLSLAVNLVTGFVDLYFLTVQSRLLGLLYRVNKEELGWFNRRR